MSTFDDFGDLEWGNSRPNPVRFADCFDRLPVNTPSNHAHIIDLSSYKPAEIGGQYDLKLQDAVVTLIFNISKGLLKRFLSASIKTFKMVHQLQLGPSNMKLIIWRRGNQVLVGQYIEYPDSNLVEWDNLIRYVINFDGTWDITEASFGKYTRSKLIDAWIGAFVQPILNREITASNDKDMAKLATSSANYILMCKCWNAEEGFKWTIKTTW
ncbi:uncharacterized protein K460DRAFT_358608 [Cucurbitaria berberidis CBS 394.84]|uniref:Uncharacterized protein n=1 Tax=Cucurbitaria berberidis CBS 394.84 TaxID=1168544 RepID=A0A9P4GAM4_9PLEO|nr:uncharacterized protein K460DRAFT_358608 [Cucurbitaria berberidis CBS 394.84]KAF1841916.1 hypothetical protein K460DRAFT_358608 [Cucurbitaria berberidis CBS 394.84]